MSFGWSVISLRFWWFNFSPRHQEWFGCSHLCLGAQRGFRQAQTLLLPISEVLFWCCWPLNFQSWVRWSHTSEDNQAAPSTASAQPHEHLIVIKFSMLCILMCTEALFWIHLVCLMPLGSSALFPSQLFSVHTFPIFISLEPVSTLDEVSLGGITDKVQLKIWSQPFPPVQDLSDQHFYEEKLHFPPLSEI